MRIVLISTSTYPSDQGLRTISSSLKRAGHKVKTFFLVMEEDYSKSYSKEVLNQMLNYCKTVDLIGVSSYASTSVRAAQLIHHLKILNKPIVWGGIHATISPDKCIEHVNIVAIGEAEETVIELAHKLEKDQDITKIRNLWVRKGNKIYKNEVRPLVDDLDKLPPPDYDLEDHYILEKNKIVRFKEKHLNAQIFFQTERGCPNACTYCSNGLLRQLYLKKGKLIRSHSIPYVINEMIRLKSKFPSLKYFDIRDETLFVRPLSEIKLFSRLYKEHVNLRFKCLADPPTMDEEKLRYLVYAGLTDIIIGIQGCERVNLQIYKRYIKDEQLLKAAHIVNKYKDKVAVMYDVITSNPYETREDIINLIRLLQKTPKPYFLSVNNLVFFLGTPLYDQAIKDGTIKTKKDTAFNLNYWDRFKHIKLKKRNEYLTLISNLMRGVVTEKRFGIMPNFLINFLLKPKVVAFNEKYKFPTYFIGYIVMFFDFLREKVAKPVYRSLPIDFKVWYDKFRYRV